MTGIKGIKGTKLWLTTLVEYDEWGQATVVFSRATPAKDSPVKYAQKANKTTKSKKVERGETALWE